jgi:2',3'-cyclic-nucleotide 2'-phosphodiesterase (5'-nucleotidase family)
MPANHWFKHALLNFSLLLLFAVCNEGYAASAKLKATGEARAKPRQFTVLAVNDIYNIEGVDARKSGSFARLRTLRAQLGKNGNPVLLLNAGDFLFPSSMSSQYQGEQMIDVMNMLSGAAGFDPYHFVTFGNHEFDKKTMKFAPVLGSRIQQSNFYWLGSNVNLSKEARLDSVRFRKVLQNNAIITLNGIKVGLFSLTTNDTIPEYATINGDYRAVATQQIADLKARGAEVIIALTHLAISQDRALLEQLGDQGPDVIFGGHEHNQQAQCVGKRCVIKADADARSATIATIKLVKGKGVKVSYRNQKIDETTLTKDPQVAALTEEWIARYEKEYCDKNGAPANCLTEVIGKTAVNLIAEELEIRRYETNLGSFIAETMMAAFDNIALPDQRKVQIALINSGSLRLNQNIPAGSDLTQWYMNGIFQYSTGLRLIEISGAQLKQAVQHSISDWTGNGWWLQSAGIAFRHDTANGRFSDLSLLDRNGKKTLVKDDERILAVVGDYLVDKSGNQDGYTMLNTDHEIKYADQLFDLKTVVTDVIKTARKRGQAINPPLPGRVCSSDRATLPCVLN